jgi:CHASE2 domain-containing sensor protein
LDEVPHGIYNDKIIIVGNSSPDAGDHHQTPIGKMAGMYIIGNALMTIIQGQQPLHLSVFGNLIIELMVIIMAAYFFLYFKSLPAHLLISTILIILLGVIGYYYFLITGVFLNFMFTLVGMGLHRLVSDAEEIIVNRSIYSHHHKNH